MTTSTAAQARHYMRLRRVPTIRFFLLTFVILGTLTTLWSLASPLMSVPDEPAHAIKAAAVARGSFIVAPTEKQGEMATVRVPGYIASLPFQTCYAQKPDITANCAPILDSKDRALTTAATSAGNYNPMYYLMVGLPSRVMGGAPAVFAMRILSGLFCAAFLTMTMVAAARFRRPQWPLISTLVALTPMVLFLSGSVNPNALEIVTTAAFFMNLCVVLENSRTLHLVKLNIVIVGISGAVLANTRALSLLWLALAAVAALLAYGWRPFVAITKDRLGIVMMGLIGLGCALSLAWLALSNSFQSLLGSPTTIGPGQAFATMLDRTFDYSSGYIGVMGWLDTSLPAPVYAFWHFAFSGLIVAGLCSRPARGRLGLAVLVLAVIVLPPILQAEVIQSLGWIWQGRYLLAVVVLLLLACGVAFRFKRFPRSPLAQSLGRWILVAAIGAHVYSFIFVLRRYTVGLGARTNWTEMGDTIWQPPMTWQGLTLVYVLTLAIGAILVHRQLFRRQGSSEVAASRNGINLMRHESLDTGNDEL